MIVTPDADQFHGVEGFPPWLLLSINVGTAETFEPCCVRHSSDDVNGSSIDEQPERAKLQKWDREVGDNTFKTFCFQLMRTLATLADPERLVVWLSAAGKPAAEKRADRAVEFANSRRHNSQAHRRSILLSSNRQTNALTEMYTYE